MSEPTQTETAVGPYQKFLESRIRKAITAFETVTNHRVADIQIQRMSWKHSNGTSGKQVLVVTEVEER